MSKFQIILLCVFGAFILIGVGVFSFTKGSKTATVNVNIWGMLPLSAVQDSITDSGLAKDQTFAMNYTEVDPADFDSKFTEAIAEGHGPDLVIITQDELWQERNKLGLIPFTTLNLADFDSTYVDEGDLFTSSSGIYGFPLLVDPMMLYTNRDLLNGAAIAQAPAFWDQFYDYANKLTIKDQAGNIKQSLIALGEAANIPHAKDILSLLMLQAGTPIIDNSEGHQTPELTNAYNLSEAPGVAALDFYTQFANPQKPFYSWNRSLTSAQTNFTSGDSALYLGFASELPLLQAKNPNINIGVTQVPQSRVTGHALTFGNMYAVSVVRTSLNLTAAFTDAEKLASSASIAALAKTSGLAPARRDLLAQRPSDGVAALSYDAAIQSKAWPDPDPTQTDQIFSDMITTVTSGRALPGTALSTAQGNISNILGE
jgi:ABC-type glycerol-3-phosphate transport system substrate-binding protein